MVAPDVMKVSYLGFVGLFTLIGFQLRLCVLLSHIAFSIPIVVLTGLLTSQRNECEGMVNAAYDLGATQWQMLREGCLSLCLVLLLVCFLYLFVG